MNETRKKIIELIEPYMYKTLTEGCLIYIRDEKGFEKFPVKSRGYKTILQVVDEGNNYEGFPGIQEYATLKYSIGNPYVNLGYYGILSDVKHIFEIEELKTLNYKFIEILGHYDITAVLKYVSRFYSGTVLIDDKGFFVNINRKKFTYDYIMINGGNFKVPHKPLNLYTDKEEKELLDLLLKLK